MLYVLQGGGLGVPQEQDWQAWSELLLLPTSGFGGEMKTESSIPADFCSNCGIYGKSTKFGTEIEIRL